MTVLESFNLIFRECCRPQLTHQTHDSFIQHMPWSVLSFEAAKDYVVPKQSIDWQAKRKRNFELEVWAASHRDME